MQLARCRDHLGENNDLQAACCVGVSLARVSSSRCHICLAGEAASASGRRRLLSSCGLGLLLLSRLLGSAAACGVPLAGGCMSAGIGAPKRDMSIPTPPRSAGSLTGPKGTTVPAGGTDVPGRAMCRSSPGCLAWMASALVLPLRCICSASPYGCTTAPALALALLCKCSALPLSLLC
jgi:hypothetical protein